jgi:SAM-dependent methyltransferase
MSATLDHQDLGFLAVDRYLATLIGARALKSAFELRLVDHLAEGGNGTEAALVRSLKVDGPGLKFLLSLLEANGVTERRRGVVALTEGFNEALRYRDLLEAKLDFAGALINDYADGLTDLVRGPEKFAGTSRLYEIFDYRRCLVDTYENWQRTRGWMRLTTALTRYEARACLQLHDFGQHRRLLDVGGNSGELALQACRQNPDLQATVVDLPLVCDIGLEHVLGEPEHARIGFLPRDLRAQELPQGYDAISFKSMLHDWPEAEALGFLEKAARAVEPGGTLLIFERGPLENRSVPPFSSLPVLLFFRSYRPASVYLRHLQALGLQDVQRQDITLDTPFYLVTARRPG